jgi:hypothetical protein
MMTEHVLLLLVVILTPLFWSLVAYAFWHFLIRKSVAGRVLGAEAALLAADKSMSDANSRIGKVESGIENGFAAQEQNRLKVAASIVDLIGKRIATELTTFKTAREDSEKALAEAIVAIQKEFEGFTREQRKFSSAVVSKVEAAQEATELHVVELASALGIVAERLRNGDAATRVKGLNFEKTSTRVDYEFLEDGKVRATTSVGGIRRYEVTHSSYGAVLDGKIYDERGKKVVKSYSYDNVD